MTPSTPDMFSVLLQLVFAFTILATSLARENMQQYTIHNKCPTPIDLYIGGEKHGTIPKNGNIVKTFSTSQGYFYTDANGGSRNAKHTIHAGFYDDYYYMVSDPKHANTGLNVRPKDHQAYNGFCPEIQCDGRGCPQAFSAEPRILFPGPASSPPPPPHYRCPVPKRDYVITFCPTGKFPNQV